MWQKALVRQYGVGSVASLLALSSSAATAWNLTLSTRQGNGTITEAPLTEASDIEINWLDLTVDLSCLVATLPASLLADRLGRKITILMTGPLLVLSWLLLVAKLSLQHLLIAKTLQGCAKGVALAVVPVYLGEISRPKIRGAIATLFVVFSCVGLTFARSVGTVLSQNAFIWLNLLPPLGITAILPWCPESPHSSAMHGDERSAIKAILWFWDDDTYWLDVSTEMSIIRSSTQPSPFSNPWKSILDKSLRTQLFILLAVAIMHVMGGATALSIHLPDAVSRGSMFEADLVMPSVTVLVLYGFLTKADMIALSLIDYAGRKLLLLGSAVLGMVILVILTIYYFLLEETVFDLSSFHWIPLVFVPLYLCVNMAGVGSVLSVYHTELFPTSCRATVSGLAAFVITIFNLITVRVFPTIVSRRGAFANYLIYLSFMVLATPSAYSKIPETKGKTFTEIQDTFRPRIV